MTTGRDKDDDATATQPKPPATWAARQAERDNREGREAFIPAAVRTAAPPHADSVFYVEIREEKTGSTEAKVVFAATGTMEDIAPSLQTIAKKFDTRWWAFWRRRRH